MSGHVDHEILDLLEGRLGEQRMEEIRRHLEECADCAADVAWARAFRGRVAAQGLWHLSPERLLELADGGERTTAEERGHLESCLACRQELEWARRQAPVEALLAAVERPGSAPVRQPAEARPPRPRWVSPWVFAGAGVAVAAALIVMLVPTRETPRPVLPTPAPPVPAAPTIRLADLARVEPLPVRFTRGATEAGSFEEARVLGLEAYEGAAYDSAREHFQAALARRPGDGEMSLYLGSAELMLGDHVAAMEPLQTASRAADPAMASEALWQLVNARLLAEQGAEALAAARDLKARDRTHLTEADSVMARIGRALSSR